MSEEVEIQRTPSPRPFLLRLRSDIDNSMEFADENQVPCTSEASDRFFINSPSTPTSHYPRSAPPTVSKVSKLRNRMVFQLENPTAQRLTRSLPSYDNRTMQRYWSKEARIVTSKDKNHAPQLSRLYNPRDSADHNYLDQCFDHLQVLGKGSFGRAIAVQSKDDGRFYAIKHTKMPVRSAWDRDERVREIRRHESIPDHPNIVKLVMGWEERGHYYLQMELCAKRGLDTICGAEPKPILEPSRIWSYLIDILLAVKHLHRHDLIHCDIKPANVLLTIDDTCKIGDFGLLYDRRHDRDNFKLNDYEGDGKYLAPEVLEKGPSEASDIFSVGITLLELCSSKHLPLRLGDFWSNGEPMLEYLEGVSEEYERLIRYMVAREPAHRPTAEQLLVNRRMNSRQFKTYHEFNGIAPNSDIAKTTSKNQPVHVEVNQKEALDDGCSLYENRLFHLFYDFLEFM